MQHVAHLPNFQDLSRDQRYLTQNDGWKTFFFYAFGLKAFGNCRRCRLPVFLFIWRKDTRSLDDVAGNSTIGHETRESFLFLNLLQLLAPFDSYGRV